MIVEEVVLLIVLYLIIARSFTIKIDDLLDLKN